MLFLFLAVFFLALHLMQKKDDSKNINGPLVVEKKACPPHKWGFQDVVDQHGNKTGERIVCAICGPLAQYSGRE